MKKVIIGLTALFMTGMTLLCLCYPDQTFSMSERRKLKQFPELSFETVISGKFMQEFEAYVADQFPFRDQWRALKASIAVDVLGQKDNNEYYEKDGHIAKIEYPLNEASISRATGIFQRIMAEQLAGKNCKVYYSVIPDKNYFLGEEHLQLDYNALLGQMQQEMTGAEYIDIMPYLEVADYYHTDTHWRQECIADVAEVLGNAMGVNVKSSYKTVKLDKPFYGVYYGQSAFGADSEALYYLVNDTLNTCVVYDYQNDHETTVYDMEKAYGKDAYELFLSGSISLLEIRNEQAKTNKELIVYRDSFGSSIAPLLAEGYAKITLVDIRYIGSRQVANFIDFENADVLFLYSTSVLNHSETLK